MGSSRLSSSLPLRWFVLAGAVASVIHFCDNAAAIGRYPEPAWITPAGVLAAWIPVGALAVFLLARPRIDTAFRVAAFAFAMLLVDGLLHYGYGSMSHMSPLSNATILFEAAAGIALAVATLVHSLRSRFRPLG